LKAPGKHAGGLLYVRRVNSLHAKPLDRTHGRGTIPGMTTLTLTTISGPELRAWLDERGTRYIWAAEKMGITPSHLTFVMRGERVLTVANAKKLAAACMVPDSTFFAPPRQ